MYGVRVFRDPGIPDAMHGVPAAAWIGGGLYSGFIFQIYHVCIHGAALFFFPKRCYTMFTSMETR